MRDDAVTSFDQLDALLAEGKITDEEYNDLWSALKRRAGNSGGDDAPAPTEKRAATCDGVPMLRKAAMLVIGLAQIACFILSVAGFPLAPIGLGIASIIMYPVAPAQPKWMKRLAFVSALCGAGIISLTIVSLA